MGSVSVVRTLDTVANKRKGEKGAIKRKSGENDGGGSRKWQEGIKYLLVETERQWKSWPK